MSSAITYKDILGAVAKNDEAARYKNFVENLGVLVNTTYYEAGDGTAAHVAAKYGNLGIIKFTVENDPSILGYRDVGDNTIFFIAIENGHIDIVKYLVENHGLDGSERDKRPNGNTGEDFYGGTSSFLLIVSHHSGVYCYRYSSFMRSWSSGNTEVFH